MVVVVEVGPLEGDQVLRVEASGVRSVLMRDPESSWCFPPCEDAVRRLWP